MKFIINRRSFSTALSAARQVAPANTLRPLLACVKLTVRDRCLEVFATNIERSVVAQVREIQIEEDGTACVSATDLRDVVTRFEVDNLSLRVDGAYLVVNGGDATAKLITLPPEGFPPVPPPVEGGTFVMDADLFRGRVAATVKLPAPHNRYAMQGVLMTDAATMVATDSRRMHHAGDPAAKVTRSAIVPPEALKIAATLAGDSMQITLGENAVRFESDDIVITTNVIEGQFPPYDEILPIDPKTTTMAKSSDVLGVIGRGGFAATESQDSDGVKMLAAAAIEVGENGITITSRSATRGEASATLATKVDGPPVRLGSRLRYLTDALAVTGDVVRLGFTAHNRPMRIDGGDVIAVIFPCNL